ncbi:MAG: hypothetical protein AB4040_20135 [Synechococcus sp.]
MEGAIAAFKEAQAFHPELKIPTPNWNLLCWLGSLHDYTSNVLFACENAVNLASDIVEIAGYRDSRGIVRALTVNTSGAIKDFKFFIEHHDNDRLKPKRQDWIDKLSVGNNPFTPEVIESLFDE